MILNFLTPIHKSARFPLSIWLAILLMIVDTIPIAGRQVDRNAKKESPIQYTVDLADARNHYIAVTAKFPATGESTELMMAVWTPGSYLVREFARNIDSLAARADDGTRLECEKSRKNRWTVQTKGVESFTISYRLYCNEISVRTNFVDRQFAIFNGAATFITSPTMLKHSHVVQLKMPAGWTRSATSLRATGESPHHYTAENFDELVDSPIVAGNIELFPFTVGGVEHHLVNVGDTGNWDGTKAATDLKRIVGEHHRMWGVIPYDRYLFLNIICESGGGLEHDNSTMIMTSRWSFRDKTRYRGWLSLASHEFFHAWNVRRLRPKSLVQYDYENEVYTESLWIAEGITSYYQDLALVRAGLLTEKEYLEKLSGNIVSIQRANGRTIQSLTDSSYDAWIKFYRPDENSSNTQVSYYSKGAVVAFLLDMKIRKLTKGKKSLDDVLRKMFASYSNSGYTAQDFRDVANDVADHDLSEWFRSSVDSTDELDFSDVKWMGLNVPGATAVTTGDVAKRKTKSKAPDQNGEPATDQAEGSEKNPARKSDRAESDGASEEDPASSKKPDPKPWLGIRTSFNAGKLIVGGVEPNSPAASVGLNSGDEVIAINGYRVAGEIESRLKQFEIGDEITLLISRRGQLLEIPILIEKAIERDWKLKPVAKPSDKQKKRMKSWLGAGEPQQKKDRR